MSLPLQQETRQGGPRPTPAYTALQNAAAWLDLNDTDRYELCGEARKDFLNSYNTQDIKSLAEGRIAPGAFLTQKGKLVSEAWVLNLPEKILLLFPSGYGPKVEAHLATFLMFANVTLENRSLQWGHFAVLGPKARDELETRLKISSVPEPGTIQICPWNGVEILVFPSHRFGANGWELLLPALQAGTWREQVAAQLPQADPLALETLRIEAGIPRMGVDMNEDNLVAEVGLDQGATSFNKGCYLGQETTARVQSRGHVNRRLCQVRLSKTHLGELPVNALQGEKKVGVLSSATESPKFGGPIGLATIQLQAWEHPEPIYFESAAGNIELKKL